MGKKSETKKFKTPTTLRFRLLKMVLLDGYLTKYAAQKLGINYSTAKAIIREGQDNFFESNLLPELSKEKPKSLEAGYRYIEPISMMPTQDEERQKFRDQEGSLCSKGYKPIEIVSRVEWNYENNMSHEKVLSS